MSLSELLALADDDGRQSWEALSLGYTETFGLAALRHEIAGTYDNVTDDEIVCFSGAAEGLYLAMQTLLEPGDHAVVVTPNYQAAETLPLAICEVSGVALRPDDHWRLDVDEIERQLRPTTKLVSVNFPNNPTGAVPDHQTWARLVELCDDRGITLFSDEVYRGLELEPGRAVSQAADASVNGLSLNVMSKAYGLPGLRIGWIACRNRDILGRLERAKHYTSICNSSPAEVLAVIALRARDQILNRNRAIVADNIPRFDAFFAAHRDLFEWAPPDGGCVCFPKYLGSDGVEAMCTALVEELGILLLPASIYSSELTPAPTDRFRIGVGRFDPDEALSLWADWLSDR